MRLAGIALGVTALVALVAALPSQADPTHARAAKKFETNVVLKDVELAMKRGTSYFNGKVKSKKPACFKSRHLVLEWEGNKRSDEGTTDEDGRFHIAVSAFLPGTWKVYAPKASEGSGITCKADRSKPYEREVR